MYFLADVDLCGTSAMLRLFYLIKLVFYGLKIIVPILCIFITTKRVFSAVISGSTQKDLIGLIPQSAKMLAAAFLFFFVPTIVEFAVNGLAEQNIDFAYCFVEADLENVERLKEQEDEKFENDKEERLEALAIQDKLYKEKEKEQIEAKKAEKANGGNFSVTRVNEDAVLASGKSNKYFAPLQNTQYYFGVKDATGGCNNNVYHDLPVAQGTPIYAGGTGTVVYYQYTCGDVLYGYGNLAVLTMPDGTYINYAHLSETPKGITRQYTKTCPKKADNSQPCPSNYCSTGLTKTVLGRRNVYKGQVIGYTGDTGNSTGPHLHVEIHEQGSNYCIADPFAAFGMR